MIKLYGVPGWGSAISEVMLTLADILYQFINVDGFDQSGPARSASCCKNSIRCVRSRHWSWKMARS